MKILFINQFFYPDAAATSQYLTDVAHALSPEDEATVICGASEYAAGVPPSGSPPPVSVVRIRNRRFGRRARYRIASYASFLIGTFTHALRLTRPDVVVTLTTPPFIALVGTLLKHVRGSRHIIWEMDVYPDIATGVGFMSPLTWFIRITSVVADYVHRHADEIIVLGRCMRDRLISHGVDPAKIKIAENWADGDAIVPAPFPEHSSLKIHYSGNLGLAHDVDTIREVMFGLRADPRFRFIFAGGGRKHEQLRSFCEKESLDSVRFGPYCAQSELSAHLAQGHIGLVTQLPGAVGSVVPSKTYGIMAAGRPVLFIGPAQSEIAQMINEHECGWHIEPGDTTGLIALLYRLAYDRPEIESRGARARSVFETHYDRAAGVSRIARLIGVAVAPEPVPSLHPAPARARAAVGGD